MTIQTALRTAAHQLSDSSTAPLDAEVLLAYVLQKNRTFLYTHPESSLSRQQIEDYKALIMKRRTGVPVAYLTGQREFWSLSLEVSQATLIPRSETELLVECTLTCLSKKKQALILDLGTGSGAIALALAKERPDCQIIATDLSDSTLCLARNNAKRLQLKNIDFIQSNWFSNLSEHYFDVIVSNPPYLKEHDPHLSEGDVRFEPRLALVSGPEGLDALIHIIKNSMHYLKSGGFLAVEHGADQKQAVTGCFEELGYTYIQSFKDYQRHDRITSGIKPQPG